MDKCFSVFNTLLTWKDCRKKMVSLSVFLFIPLSIKTQIWTSKQINIDEWTNSVLRQFKDLFNLNMWLKSFIDLRSEYNISDKDFLKYLQIWSVAHSLIKANKLQFGLSEVEDILISSDTIKGKISEFYNILSQGGLSSFQTLMKIWEKELEMSFEENTWLNIIFERTHFPFTSNKIK